MASAEIPSENFLLHLLPDRQAIVMAVANNRGEDARIDLCRTEETKARPLQPDVVRQGRQDLGGGPPGPRGLAPARRDQGGRGQDRRLDWTAPFSAQWRVDWRLRGRLTASWEMAAQMKSGEFLKYGWFGSPGTLPADRKRWTTVLGSFLYPCWLDQARRGHLQPLTKPDRFEGPAVIYPIQRAKETPLREFTVVDIVRATLGVGPCEYILDVEGQGTTMKGRATCATRDALAAIYSAKQQKRRRAEIETILDDVVIFVKHIRGRIEQYVDFGHETLAYLQQQKKAHPELSDVLADLEASARAIDAAYAKHKAAIQTPQYVVDLTEKFRKTLLDYEGDDALKKCTGDYLRHRRRGRQPGRAGGRVPRRREGLAAAGGPGAGHRSPRGGGRTRNPRPHAKGPPQRHVVRGAEALKEMKDGRMRGCDMSDYSVDANVTTERDGARFAGWRLRGAKSVAGLCRRRPPTLPKAIHTKTGIDMVLIPAGEFTLGDDDGENDEQPAHRVRLAAFYMDAVRGDPGVVPGDHGAQSVEGQGPRPARGTRELVGGRAVLQHALDRAKVSSPVTT